MKVPLQVEVYHDSIGTLLVEARDMSDGGLFLLMDECFQLAMGECVTVRTRGLGVKGAECGPALVMRVVRKEQSGIGLALIDAPAKPEAHSEIESESRSAYPEQPDDSVRAVLQSLFIINEQEQVLFCMQGDHWRPPCRQLQDGESWQDGLEQSLARLEADDILPNMQKLETGEYCYPSGQQSRQCLDLLIPCRFPDSVIQQDDSSTNKSYRWIPLAQLHELDYGIDKNTVDKLVARV